MLKGCASDTALSKNEFYCIFLFMYLCEISWLFLNALEAYNGVLAKKSIASITGYLSFIAYNSLIYGGLRWLT